MTKVAVKLPYVPKDDASKRLASPAHLLFTMYNRSLSGIDLQGISSVSHGYFSHHSSAVNANGGARRDRTDDLLLAKQALSQLSYGPDPQARTELPRARLEKRGGPGKT